MKNKKRYKLTTTGQKVYKTIKIIIFLILIATLTFSLWNIIFWMKDNNDTQKQEQEIIEKSNLEESHIDIDEDNKDISLYNASFEELREINQDVIAWLVVGGTNINYPVVQTNNNSYYLNHSFNKKKNNAGWPFMDYKNNIDNLDNNTVIYGHNRVDKSIFGTLENTYSNKWFQEQSNHYINLSSENKKYLFRIFSVYKIEVEDYYITTSFKNDTSYKDFLNTIKERSKFNFDLKLNQDDKILTLSTCINESSKRYVVHAKLIYEE